MKIGVVGAGHLGSIHLKCIQQIEEYDLVGIYEQDLERGKEIARTYNCSLFDDVESLVDVCEVVDIVTPTPSHFDIAKKALAKGKHVFIEKPITETSSQAMELHQLANSKQVFIQVGHVERFNPAFLAAQKESILQPMFIEGHRLAQFNPRGTDVSVILDLMIHDLDLILSIVDSDVLDIQASGVAVVSEKPDICNARISFKNGCVANLTASRISLKNMRKLRLFQPSAYVSIDLLEKEVQIVQLHNEQPTDGNYFSLETEKGTKYIAVDMPDLAENNAIREELRSFYLAITQGIRPTVDSRDGYRSIQLAEWIAAEVEKHPNTNASI